MNEATKPEDAPGHYGAGYGEQVPDDAPPRPAPKTDAAAPAAPLESNDDSVDAAAATTLGDDGAPVIFTPEDVGGRPPDRTPTESAPESEKAGLIFERS
jgi:hypothetical protein